MTKDHITKTAQTETWKPGFQATLKYDTAIAAAHRAGLVSNYIGRASGMGVQAARKFAAVGLILMLAFADIPLGSWSVPRAGGGGGSVE